MHIDQRNVFGPNIVNGPVDRTATPELAIDLARQLADVGASAVAIHYEHDGETEAFVGQLAPLLGERLRVVKVISHTMSGIPPGALAVEAPTDGMTGYLRIGTQ